MDDWDIEACYERYAPMVFRRCRALLGNGDEALDAVQDVFLKLIRGRKRLQARFPSSLLYTIATNVCLNRLRGRKRQGLPAGTPEELALGERDPAFARIEAGMLLDTVLESEPESTRAICFMYHGDEMTLKEIGDALGMSISGVRKRLAAFGSRARRKIEGGNTYG